jgi:hypothetical protein
MKKKSSSKGYTKYRTFVLPKAMIDCLLLKSNYIESQIELNKLFEIGCSVINDILSKSDYFKSEEDYPFHTIPMDSRYLKLKYGNDYKTYTHFLSVNSIIWKDKYYEGKASYYYLHDIDTCLLMINSILNDSNIKIEEIITTYCFKYNYQISSVTLNNKGIQANQKNRIYDEWYQIRIPINKQNQKYLVKDYESESTYINNAPAHIKKMGSHYRKNLDIRFDDAINHTNEQYINELSNNINDNEKIKAYRRYSSRIASLTNIKNGRLNKTLRFKRNNTNFRLDTNLTNMASDLRPFIVGYENMAYLDLSNSQPVLFNILLQSFRKNASDALINEIEIYFDLTINGKWYDWLIKVFKIEYIEDDNESYKIAREKCKKIWMLIAYSENDDAKGIKRIFKKHFPLILSIIDNIKKENYAQFAISLQIIESKIFIDKICRELVKVGIIPYTMHDGLLVPAEMEDQTYEIMASILKNELGAVPKIKVE